MKKLKKGDIVTPKKDIAGFSTKNQYQVIDVESDLILLVNDFNYRIWRHNGYFHNITVYPIFDKICNFVNKILGL